MEILEALQLEHQQLITRIAAIQSEGPMKVNMSIQAEAVMRAIAMVESQDLECHILAFGMFAAMPPT